MDRGSVDVFLAIMGTAPATNVPSASPQAKPSDGGHRPVYTGGGSGGAIRYDVFLCHNRVEKPLVKDIADALQVEAGLLFFLDEYSIPASVEFLEYIRNEMRRSASCAIFLGPAGWGPTHLSEARLALDIKAERSEFRIIPVKLPGSREEDWAELFGSGSSPPYNWIELTAVGDDAALRKLIPAVQGQFSPVSAGPEVVTPYYIRRQAALWDKSGRTDNSLLVRGRLLQRAQTEAAANPAFVSVNAVPAYLARCVEAERNRLRLWLALSLLALATVVILSTIAVFQRSRAEREARSALVRSLVTIAPRSIGEERNDERAALLARQAFLIDKQDGAPSGYLVDGALAEVLGAPYFSSVYKLPEDAWPYAVSSSGGYFLSNPGHPLLTGPVVTSDGTRSAETLSVPLDSANATFLTGSDNLLTASASGEIAVRSVSDPGHISRPLASVPEVPRLLVSSTDGSHVAAVLGERRIMLIDVASGQLMADWTTDSRIDLLALAASGGMVATSDTESGKLRVYRPGSERPLDTYPGEDAVNSFEFVPDGAVLVGERGGGLWLWDPTGRRSLRQLDTEESSGSIDTMAVSRDGALLASASGSIAPGLSLWRPALDPARTTVIPGVRGVILLSFTQDSRFLISATTSGEIRYWRLQGTGARSAVLARDKQPFPLPGRLYAVTRGAQNDVFIVGGDHGVIQVWPSSSLDDEPQILATERAAALSQVPDQESFTTGGRNYLTTGHVMSIAVAENGGRFATVDPYGFALVWNLKQLRSIPKLVISSDERRPAFSVALSPDGNLLAVGITSTLTFLHTLDETGGSASSLPLAVEGHATVRALRFLDEEHLLVGDDSGRLTLWTLGGKPTRRSIFASGPLIGAISALSSDRIVIGRGDQIDVLDLSQSAVTTTTLTKGFAGVISLAVSDDRELLAAGFADGTIRIWSTRNLAAPPASLAIHTDYVRSLAFDRSGGVIISVGDDGMIRRSVIGLRPLADLSCQVVWRDLDANELREYFGSMSPMLPTCANINPSTPDPGSADN